MALSYSEEFITTIAPARLFEAGAVDIHTLAPKILPQFVAEFKIGEGDGGAGTIKKVAFAEAIPWDYVLESVDLLDKENFEVNYTIFEGGDFGKTIKKACYVIKLTPLPEGGCICKVSADFHPMEGVELNVEAMETMKAQDIGQFKVVEAYLLANPFLVYQNEILESFLKHNF